MKRFLVFCVVLVTVAASAQAQGVHFGLQGDFVNFNFGLAPTTLPVASVPGVTSLDLGALVKQVYGLGYGGGVHIDLDMGLLAFRLSGDYVMLSPDKAKYQAAFGPVIGPLISVDGGRIDIYSGNLNLKLNILPLPVIHVYATGGAGIVDIKFNEAKLSLAGIQLAAVKPFDTQTKPTLNAGAGVDIKLGPVAIFAELKVNFILTQDKTSSEVPLATVGITF